MAIVLVRWRRLVRTIQVGARMRRVVTALVVVLAGLVGAGCSSTDTGPARSAVDATSQVIAAERAFAATMAARDLDAFASYVSPEAVFFTGPTPLRGRDQVRGFWSRFFIDPEPPFSWEPEEVEVLESGTLALSSGPVRDPSGEVVSRFNSIWRLDAPGTWRVIFDKGSPVAPRVE